jgi:hypothetical protein
VRLHRLLVPLAAAGLLAGVLTAGGAAAAPGFTSASAASIRPGAMLVTAGAQCTANFFFTDPRGEVYVGQSAHCAGTGEATETDGCRAGSLPLGTPVEIRGATRPGTLVYSSWLAMQRAGERDRNACAYNDFALVRLHPADVGRSNPTVPLFGGPDELDRDGTRSGEQVVSWGNSSLRLGQSALSPKRGVSLGSSAGRWNSQVYTATPGIPGDSGSGVLDARGLAVGTVSTVAIAPLAGSNGVSDLQRQLAYARLHGMPGLTLVPGTVPFKGAGTLR